MTYRLLLRRLPQISSTFRDKAPSFVVRSSLLAKDSPDIPSTQFRAFRLTCVRLDETDSKAEPSDKGLNEVEPTSAKVVNPVAEEDEPDFVIPKYADRPEDCPVWQNPLHHNNPEYEKVYPEDFPDGEMPILPLPPLEGTVPPHIEALANDILHLSVLEMHELVKMVQEHFGWTDEEIDGGMPMGGGGGGGAAAEAEVPVVEEKTIFDLKLTAYDDKAKIKVIKEIRAIAGLGLKEAKELVEGAPKVVKKGIKREEAEELKAKLEEIGATIEIV